MNRPSKNTRRLIALTDIDNIVKLLPEIGAKKAKRQLREPLLSAFDTHKASVIYEGKKETSEEKDKVLAWKQSLLDLDTNAFKDIPQNVKYYL